MPRAVSNRPARTQGPYQRSQAPASSGRSPSDAEKGDRRESGLRALSRRISQVFSRAAGWPTPERSDEEDGVPNKLSGPTEPAAESQIIGDTSEESQHSIVSRAPSASRKASINLSLLRSQRDLRLPAHMIVEAYREALREKAEVNHHKRVASSSESSVSSEAPPRKVAKGDRSATSVASSNLAVARKPKPIKHKIQLVTKPVLDLSALPEDRKKRPGFISANFDVSDDESEPELEPAPTSEPATALLRRPQVASDKLQRAFTEAPEATDEVKGATSARVAPAPLFGAAAPAAPQNGGSGLSGEAPKLTSQQGSEAPKFQFGATAANEVPKDAPKFSLGATKEEAPKFSFGGSSAAPTAPTGGTATAKPLFGAQGSDPVGKPAEKPLFSFSGSANSNTQPQKPELSFGPPASKRSEGTPAEKPAFSFGSTPADENKSADKPVFSFGASGDKPAAATPKFQFGASNGELAQKSKSDSANAAAPAASANTPAFSFGMKPTLQFGANGGTSTLSGVGAAEPAGSLAPPASSSSTPQFSFGPPAGTKPGDDGKTATPAFGFGNKPDAINANSAASGPEPGAKPSSSAPDGPKPSTAGFAFPASVSGDKPTFSFGASNGGTKASSKPSISFGAAPGSGSQLGHKPTLSFTAPGNTGVDKPTSTAFNFSIPQSKQEETPKFSFGAGAGAMGGSDKPAFSFGAPNGSSAPDAKAGAGSKPVAVFGANASAGQGVPAGQSQPPVFGGSKPASPAPFGAGNASGPSAFTFGAKQGTPEASGLQPAFSFGAPGGTPFGAPSGQGQQQTPFGAQQPASQPQPFQTNNAPAAGNGSKSSTPFAFGAPAPGSGETTPSFAFGQTQGAPGAVPAQFGSRETTPGAGSTQRRKIAQVKRRLRR